MGVFFRYSHFFPCPSVFTEKAFLGQALQKTVKLSNINQHGYDTVYLQPQLGLEVLLLSKAVK